MFFFCVTTLGGLYHLEGLIHRRAYLFFQTFTVTDL